MNEDTKTLGAQAPGKTQLTVAILLLLGGIVAYYVLSSQPAWMRWLAVVGGAILAVIVFATSPQGRNLWRFGGESKIELRKIVWPNRQETGMTTLVVFGFVVIAGLFFWVLDLILAWATRALTGQGG